MFYFFFNRHLTPSFEFFAQRVSTRRDFGINGRHFHRKLGVPFSAHMLEIRTETSDCLMIAGLNRWKRIKSFEVITMPRFLTDKRPATLVLPAAPRRPTRGGHQAGWVNMPSGSRGARRQQQTRQVRYDLHLPSMPALTCKTSSQALLLRVLKVILQLREAARRSSSGATTLRTRALQRRGKTGF